VGLLAVITRPSAVMSRTRSPRLTSAMRTREPSNDWLPPDQAETSQAASSTTSSALPPPSSHSLRLRRPMAAGDRTWSWAEVSRMWLRVSMR
jgi:hypothetical protein